MPSPADPPFALLAAPSEPHAKSAALAPRMTEPMTDRDALGMGALSQKLYVYATHRWNKGGIHFNGFEELQILAWFGDPRGVTSDF